MFLFVIQLFGQETKSFSNTMKYQLAILTICSFSHLLAEEPKDLTLLRQSWTKAREQATAPIDKKYADALDAMKVRFTKSGDLTSALAVDAELKSLPGGSTTTSAPASQDAATAGVRTKGGLEKAISDTIWTVVHDEDQKPWGQAEFKAGGKFSGFNKTDLPWKVLDKETVTVQAYEFKFSKDLSQFTVVWGGTGKLTGTRKIP